MNRRRQLLVAAGVGIAAAAAGAGVYLWRLGTEDAPAGALMALQLPDLTGRVQAMGQWHGKVVVVNFWATWCAPCREEIPSFVALQEKYGTRGLHFVGIAIDQRDKVKAFAQEFRMNYTVLLGGLDTVDLTRQAGNRIGALPFTLVLDRNGHIVSRELGKVKEAQLEKLLLSLL